VLTAGRADANLMGQLASERIRTVIKEASTSFDWVLLDTPPVGLLPDAQLVARVSDGILFVVAAGATPCALVQHSIAELGPEHRRHRPQPRRDADARRQRILRALLRREPALTATFHSADGPRH
jgi:hypothetical protein